MAPAFRRWGPPLISVVFASGLQLSNAVQEGVGWFLIGLAVVLAGVYVWVERRTETKGTRVGKGDENSGDQNINYGQQGIGINKGTINIIAPQPSVDAERMTTNKKTDDGYVSEIRVLIKDGYAAQRVGVKFSGATIKGGVLASATGITQNYVEKVEPHEAIFNAGPPVVGNEYIAQVVTEQPDNLSVEVGIQ